MMATQLSKADKIRKLLHLSNAEIAKRIGCTTPYVRAVRQRTSQAGNPITDNASRNWKSANRDLINRRFRERYSSDPEFRSRHTTRVKEWRSTTAKLRSEPRAS